MADRAEERALEAYPKAIRDIDGIVVDVGHPQYMRDLYIEGYHQAEKDVKERLLLMLNTSIDNEHFFEQLDDYIEELETSNER